MIALHSYIKHDNRQNFFNSYIAARSIVAILCYRATYRITGQNLISVNKQTDDKTTHRPVGQCTLLAQCVKCFQ